MNAVILSFQRIIAIGMGALIILMVAGQLGGTNAVAEEARWQEILTAARGQSVDWFMWGGFPSTNNYVNGFVAERVKALYDIKLRQVPVKDISEIVSKLLVEKQAGKDSQGKVDLMWINGENFRTAKRNHLLYGPFAKLLPNQKLVDWQRPSVYNDFGEPVNGMESPWGSAQVVFHYDMRRTPQPPQTMQAMLQWIREHPGRFAYPAPPDFTGSVFVRHVFYQVAGDVDSWQGPLDETRWVRLLVPRI